MTVKKFHALPGVIGNTSLVPVRITSAPPPQTDSSISVLPPTQEPPDLGEACEDSSQNQWLRDELSAKLSSARQRLNKRLRFGRLSDEESQIITGVSFGGSAATVCGHVKDTPPPPFNQANGLPDRWETGTPPQDGFLRASLL